ncbi:hypothetical protein YPPY25_3675, partial [Yersinia pestis PY-25]
MMAGAVFPLLIAIKPAMRITRVVKHAIEHQLYSYFTGSGSQLQEITLSPQVGINLIIIFSIIFMHTGSGKNRVQIQCRNPQLLKVRDFLT